MLHPSCPTSRSTGRSWSAGIVAPSCHRGRRGARDASRSRRCSTRPPADLENIWRIFTCPTPLVNNSRHVSVSSAPDNVSHHHSCQRGVIRFPHIGDGILGLVSRTISL